MTDETQRQNKKSDLIIGLEGYPVPVLSVPKLSPEETREDSLGEKFFYRLMRLRGAIRDSQPERYKLLYGVYNF